MEHVVGDIYDVADRARADRFDARREPLGARPDCHPTNDRRHVARCAFGVVDADIHRVSRGRLDCAQQNCGRMLRTMQLIPCRCCDLACKPFVGQQVGAIGKDVDDDSSVADRHDVEKRGTRSSLDIESEDSLMISAQAELARRAQHSCRDCAANLALLDLQSAGQCRADTRERIELAFDNVWCAAHDIVQRTVAGIDLRHPQVIGVGMMRCFDHAANDDIGEVASQCDHVIDCRTAHRENIAQLIRRHVDVDEIAQPLV